MEQISIFDITTGINWTNDKRFYYTLNKEYELLVEYLNTITLPYIDREIIKLNDFNKVFQTQDFTIIDHYIMNSLDGYNEQEDGIFAFIAGARDFTVGLWYDYKNYEVFIRPVYGNNEKYLIDITILISILEQSKTILLSLTALNTTL